MTKPLLSYYYDEDGKKPLKSDGKGNYEVDFGPEARKNPPIAGVTSISTVVYMKNDHDYPMELKPSTLDKDLTITEYPEFLEPGQIGRVTFAFSPSIDRIKPLLGGSWDFSKIVYSK